MPELPEVETIVADLRPHLVGRTVERCELSFPTIVRHPEPEEFIDAVTGMRIESVTRRGKYILIGLEPSGPRVVRTNQHDLIAGHRMGPTGPDGGGVRLGVDLRV